MSHRVTVSDVDAGLSNLWWDGARSGQVRSGQVKTDLSNLTQQDGEKRPGQWQEQRHVAL